jgi:hypothetical protein
MEYNGTIAKEAIIMEKEKEQEKVFIHFKTTNSNKTGLEMLAKKDGVSVTHYLNTLIFNAIKGDIVGEAQTTALWDAILEFEMPRHFYMELRYFPNNIWERVNSILGDEKGRQFGERWKELLTKKIYDGCQRLGINDFEIAYNELTAGLDNKK